ncbi:MAG: hypothetical protein WAM82_35050 [Thermoanaerobaculia bacterium]
MGIDLFLTGLMLICLDSQAGCQVGNYQNTAWIINAAKNDVRCGVTGQFTTTLAIEFAANEFVVVHDGLKTCTGGDLRNCPIPDTACGVDSKELYVNLLPSPEGQSINTQGLPQIDDIDSRFGKVNQGELDKLRRIRFQTGVISAAANWPPVSANAGKPRKWFRSNFQAGGSLPSELSDRLKARYEGATLFSVMCSDRPLLILQLAKDTGSVTIGNFADALLKENDVDNFDDLTYLLWYYYLGTWSGKECPDYKRDGSGAVVLRCVQEEKDKRCSYYGGGASGTRFWPPTLQLKR